MTKTFKTPPDLADIEDMARASLSTIPEPLRRFTENVVIRVEDFPDADVAREFALETPFDLLGLYRGVSLGQKSVSDLPTDVDMIWLYRRPILDFWCETGDSLKKIVRHVLIHEIGHHFGFSDEDMDRIEEQA